MEVIRHMYTFVFMYICICICMCIYTYIEVSGRLKWLSFDCSHITEMVPGGRDGSDTSAKKGLHPDLLNIAHCFNCICIYIFIGPESDHWLCLSLTNSLTHSTPCADDNNGDELEEDMPCLLKSE